MDKSPHVSNFVSVNGIRLNYLDWGGDGPALLFLAGRGCNAHIFDDFAPRFTPHFRVLALTRRAHGDSDYPETGYDIDTLTEDIRQSLDALGIRQAILAGHSLAGIELTHFAALYPERLLKLVYIDAAYDYSTPGYKALMEQNPARKIKIPGDGQDFYTLAGLAAFIKFAYPSLGAIWGELMEEHMSHEVKFSPEGKVVDKMSPEIDAAIVATFSAYRPEYSLVRSPALGIFAIKKSTYYVSYDYMTPEQQAEMVAFEKNITRPWNEACREQFRREAPHARVVEIPDAHHYCFIPQADQVYEAMLDFLLEK